MTRHGAQGPQRRQKAADGSIATAQNHRRWLIWDDVVTSLEEKHHDASGLKELERLRIAS
jgi:hypothetical protein